MFLVLVFLITHCYFCKHTVNLVTVLIQKMLPVVSNMYQRWYTLLSVLLHKCPQYLWTNHYIKRSRRHLLTVIENNWLEDPIDENWESLKLCIYCYLSTDSLAEVYRDMSRKCFLMHEFPMSPGSIYVQVNLVFF